MKRIVIAGLIGCAPLGAMVGALLKLDARDNGWSKRGWTFFIAAGTIVCSIGLITLLWKMGGFGPGSD